MGKSHPSPGYLICPRQVGERLVLCGGSPAQYIPGYLICPRQVGERKIYCPVAVIALPVVLRAALVRSQGPIYDVLGSTEGFEKKKMVDGLAP